jgi:hypothetical protein
MNTATATSTVTITPVALGPWQVARLEIRINGEILCTTKDGGNLVQRVDRILKANKVYRESGFTTVEGSLAATAYDLR